MDHAQLINPLDRGPERTTSAEPPTGEAASAPASATRHHFAREGIQSPDQSKRAQIAISPAGNVRPSLRTRGPPGARASAP